MAEFSFDNLSLERAERLVAEGLSARVQSGAVLLLTGPNGSGKSSLLRALAGLMLPAAGRIAWDGIDIHKNADAHRARLDFVGHQDAVKPGLSAQENLRFWAGMGGGDAGAALGVFKLNTLADRPARFLSAGQRRRLALSRLALRHKALWLLDEPTTALDADSRAAFQTLLKQHVERGGIAIIATHDELGVAAQRLVLQAPGRRAGTQEAAA
jgi:heme exporter protein A